MVHSSHAAEEIVQEVFIRLWEHREMLTEVKSPADFIFILVRNYTLNYLRSMLKEEEGRERLWAALEQRASQAHADTPLETKETAQLLQKIVAKLTDQQRRVFRMSREEGLSHQEIASELHISKNTVKKHVADSIKMVKVHLKELGFPLLIFFSPFLSFFYSLPLFFVSL